MKSDNSKYLLSRLGFCRIIYFMLHKWCVFQNRPYVLFTPTVHHFMTVVFDLLSKVPIAFHLDSTCYLFSTATTNISGCRIVSSKISCCLRSKSLRRVILEWDVA